MDEESLVKEALKRASGVETVPLEEDEVPLGRGSSIGEKVKKIAGGIVRDHKNWSDRLVDEGFFKSKSEARAYASYMRAKGYYAKVVKVQGGYKVYVYTKKGPASAILSGDWKGMKKLEKLDTKPVKGKKVQDMSFTMGSVSMGTAQIGRSDFNFNISSDFTDRMKGLGSFSLNLDLGDFRMDFDFGEFGLGGLRGGNHGKKRR